MHHRPPSGGHCSRCTSAGRVELPAQAPQPQVLQHCYSHAYYTDHIYRLSFCLFIWKGTDAQCCSILPSTMACLEDAWRISKNAPGSVAACYAA